MNYKKVIATIMALTICGMTTPLNDNLVSEVSLYADAYEIGDTVDSGSCGDSLSWELIKKGEDSYILNIDGSGDMYSYDEDENIAPWYSYCYDIETINLCDGLTSIGDYAFNNVANIKAINVPESVTSIGNGAFKFCYSLIETNIPDGVTYLGDEAYYYCENLVDITLPEGITTLGECAFFKCSSLESIVIPNAITSIGDYAFKYCTNLSSVTIGDSVQTLGNDVFCYCSSLTDIVFPDSITSVGYCVLLGCDSLTNVTLSENISELPSYSYENGFFTDCINLQSIVIPNSVTTIDTSAFKGCTNLQSVVLGTGVTTINSYAFNDCESLTEISINSDITSLSSYAFDSNNNITTLNISADVTTIDDSFLEFPNIQSINIDIGNTYYKVQDDTLYTYDLSQLLKCFSYAESFDINPNTTQIFDNAFSNCKNLKSVSIPASVETIQYNSFDGCINLTEFIVDENNSQYQSIDGVLFNKNGYKIIKYPCGKSGEYSIPSGVLSVSDYAFYNCQDLTSIIIPDSVVNIGSGAFYNCSNLDNISLGSGIETIESNSFYGCTSLMNIVIPESVTSIGYYAFSSCSRLKSIIFKGDAPSISLSAFDTSELNVYCYFDKYGWTDIQEGSVFPESTKFYDINEQSDNDTLYIIPSTLELSAGETYQLSTSINPLIASVFDWQISDTSVAMVSNSGLVTAFQNGEAIVTATSKDGKYTAQCTITVTGNLEKTSYELIQLQDGSINYNSPSSECQQIVCEPLHGIYFLNGSTLSFYSFASDTYNNICTFYDCDSAYYFDNKLYILYNQSNSTYVATYDLINQVEMSTIKLSGYTGTAVGVDSSNNIYVATSDNSVYRMFLLSQDGEVISQTKLDDIVYNFCGFDSTNGNFYFEGYYNWLYWGYEHNCHALKIGNLTEDNQLNISDSMLSFTINYGGVSMETDLMLCQNEYLSHKYNVQLLNDKYLAVTSAISSQLQIFNSNSFDLQENAVDINLALSRDALEEDSYYDTYDLTSIGTRTVYNSENDTFIVYTNDNTLTEYNAQTGKEIATFNTKYHVFNLLIMDNQVVAIEKSDDAYYIELIDWAEPTSVSIDAETDTLIQGQSEYLSVVTDSKITKNYTWSSSDSRVASVSSDGKVVAWHEGTAKIIATSSDGKQIASYTITVLASDTSVPDKNILSADGTVSNNVSDNNYSTYGSVVNSYIVENSDNTLSRVEYIYNTGIVVETYSSTYQLLSSTTIDLELSFFGGFYSNDDYNFLVFGQSNYEEDDNCEVVRVVKYSKDWQRLDDCSIYGANTYIPFDAGSLRMTETNGNLYIHTCHEMYDHGDGLHHQANMTFVINQETLKVEQSSYDVMYIGSGYVSHSFNQFIKTDGEYVYRVDHGDAYPRAITITRCSADGDITSVNYRYALDILGGTGDNSTGVSIGGLELSESNCLIVGNSVDQSDSDTYSSSGQRNIFVSVVGKELDNTNVVWLTDYTEDDNITPRTPQLVKVGENQFLIMWEEFKDGEFYTTKVATINDFGSFTSNVMNTSMRLSDCQPIFTSDGLVTWYVTDSTNINMHVINPYNVESINDSYADIIIGDVNSDGSVKSNDLLLLKKYLLGLVEESDINYANSDINSDGSVKSNDLLNLKKILLGIED